MTTKTNCCKCFRLDIGCLVLSLCTFMMSLFGLIIPIVFFHRISSGEPAIRNGSNFETFVFKAFRLEADGNLKNQEFILLLVTVTVLCCMLSSLALAAGVIWKKPGLLLCFFGYIVYMTLIGGLSVVLLLIHGLWLIAFVVFVISLSYVYFNTAVLEYYEFLRKEISQQQFQDFIDTDQACLTQNIVL